MRLLFVHSDYLEFEATTEADEGLAETEDAPAEGRMEDCVTAFVAVETGDGADPDAVVENAAEEVRDVTDRLRTAKAVLYPCAHLSDDSADSERARTVLRDLEAALADDFEVLRAPVGRHAAVEVRSKGHPFSHLSRRVTTERPEDGERAPSEWRLLFPDGEVRDPRDPRDLRDLSEATADDRPSDEGDDLRALVGAEIEGNAPSMAEASRSDLLRERGLAADPNESDDPGERRWYPRGTVVRDALADYAKALAVEFGATPVETPDGGDPLGDDLALAGVSDAREREYPLRLYATSNGDRFGTMRSAAGDPEEAREEFRAQARLAVQVGDDLGLEFRPVVRVTRSFRDANESWLASLVEDLGTPALLEIAPEQSGRPSVAVEFAAVDGDGPVEVATVELDDGEGGDGDGASASPVVRYSPVGERVVDALVAAAADRDPPRLPTWLSPTQVRFVPVGEDHVEHCLALAEDLRADGIRADVDDRDETVGERIAAAEADWVPHYAVVGDREVEGSEGVRDDDGLAVTDRSEGVERETTIEGVREAILDAVGDLPRRRLGLPTRVGRHPEFPSQ